MKKKLSFSIILAFLLLFYAKTASAIGLGVEVDMGFSKTRFIAHGAYGKYLSPVETYVYTRRFESVNFIGGGGLTLDTCVAGTNIFNYRLKISFDCYQSPYFKTYEYYMPFGLFRPDIKQSFDPTLKLGIKHIMGLRIYGNETVRVWLGPTISMSFYPQLRTHFNIFSNLFVLGLSCGVNYNLNELMSLVAECGFTYDWWIYKIKYSDDLIPIFFDVSIGVMFRVDESRSSRTIQLQEI